VIPSESLLRWFEFAHLPPPLQTISRQFALLATGLCADLPACAERTVALRKLLESKDAAVRAAILATDPKPTPPTHIQPKEG
jgi:hypothetical protein